MDLIRLKADIKQNEGFRGLPYLDTQGKVTIGFGRNLTDNPLTEDEGWGLSMSYILAAYNDAHALVASWSLLNDARQNVLVELVYNIGLGKALGFKKMCAALDQQDYVEAANQLLDSQWRIDVGPTRSVKMAKQLETGEFA